MLLLIINFYFELCIVNERYGNPLKFLILSLKYFIGILKYLQTIYDTKIFCKLYALFKSEERFNNLIFLFL